MTGWIVAFAFAQALDSGTTCSALASGRASEVNPIIRSCGGAIALKAGMVTAYGPLMRPLFRSHPIWAKAITVGLSALPVLASVHNVKAVR